MLPVLGADMGAEPGLEVGAGVAGRKDAGDSGASAGVDAHAAVTEAAVVQPGSRRLGSDCDEEQVALDPAPILELDCMHTPVAVEARDPRGER